MFDEALSFFDTLPMTKATTEYVEKLQSSIDGLLP
jgi:hypothetical protein